MMTMTPGKPAAGADVAQFQEGLDAAGTDQNQPVSAQCFAADWLAGNSKLMPCSQTPSAHYTNSDLHTFCKKCLIRQARPFYRQHLNYIISAVTLLVGSSDP